MKQQILLATLTFFSTISLDASKLLIALYNDLSALNSLVIAKEPALGASGAGMARPAEEGADATSISSELDRIENKFTTALDGVLREMGKKNYRAAFLINREKPEAYEMLEEYAEQLAKLSKLAGQAQADEYCAKLDVMIKRYNDGLLPAWRVFDAEKKLLAYEKPAWICSGDLAPVATNVKEQLEALYQGFSALSQSLSALRDHLKLPDADRYEFKKLRDEYMPKLRGRLLEYATILEKLPPEGQTKYKQQFALMVTGFNSFGMEQYVGQWAAWALAD